MASVAALKMNVGGESALPGIETEIIGGPQLALGGPHKRLVAAQAMAVVYARKLPCRMALHVLS